MNVKKMILAILAVAVFHVLVGMLTCGGVFNWVYKLEPTSVWKPIQSISPLVMIGSMVFIDVLFVFVYALINKGIPGANRFVKGVVYGLLVVLVGLVPGMIETYLYMTVATTVVIYWTIWGLVVSPIKGLIAATIYGE